MVTGQFLYKLEAAARIIRRTSDFFGGILLIVIADFSQLPPVELLSPKNAASAQATEAARKKQRGLWLFESETWKKAQFLNFKLTHNWRYGADAKMASLADLLRMAVDGLSEEAFALMSGPSRAPLP